MSAFFPVLFGWLPPLFDILIWSPSQLSQHLPGKLKIEVTSAGWSQCGGTPCCSPCWLHTPSPAPSLGFFLHIRSKTTITLYKHRKLLLTQANKLSLPSGRVLPEALMADKSLVDDFQNLVVFTNVEGHWLLLYVDMRMRMDRTNDPK